MFGYKIILSLFSLDIMSIWADSTFRTWELIYIGGKILHWPLLEV